MKFCVPCQEFKDHSEFGKDKSKHDGLSYACKNCKKIYISGWQKRNADKCSKNSKEWKRRNPHRKNATEAKRRSAKYNRTPAWLSESQLNEILKFYEIAKSLSIKTGEKYEVDHIIPLQGEEVSGLHVPWNLQVITKRENCSKNNVLKVG